CARRTANWDVRGTAWFAYW
nr:immunoglobulin heavy chain junction region [Mus musculus]